MLIMRDGKIIHDSNIAEMQVPSQFLHRDSPLSFKEAMIASEIVTDNGPRANGFNYGTGWGKDAKPSIYFDAVRLSVTLERLAHDATARAWRLTTALRNVRLAETKTEKADAIATLQETYTNLIAENADQLNIARCVDALADQIDIIAPPNIKGYVPHMGLHYAVAPLRKIINAFKRAVK